MDYLRYVAEQDYTEIDEFNGCQDQAGNSIYSIRKYPGFSFKLILEGDEEQLLKAEESLLLDYFFKYWNGKEVN